MTADVDLAPLYSRRQIDQRVRDLAAEIRLDYAGRDLVVVGVLKGALIFMADLVRALDMDVRFGFVSVSSYGAGTESSGSPIVRGVDGLQVAGADLLVVEDIMDTGLSMRALLDTLRERSPRSVRACVLIDKRERRVADVLADYVGFQLASGFVVGYGIDYAERYRNLPEIYRIRSIRAD